MKMYGLELHVSGWLHFKITVLSGKSKCFFQKKNAISSKFTSMPNNPMKCLWAQTFVKNKQTKNTKAHMRMINPGSVGGWVPKGRDGNEFRGLILRSVKFCLLKKEKRFEGKD